MFGITDDLEKKYEFHNYNHALEIITQAFPKEWNEIVDCLKNINITLDDLTASGGNETNIPKKFDRILYPLGWREIKITGDLIIKKYPRKADQRGKGTPLSMGAERALTGRSFGDACVGI